MSDEPKQDPAAWETLRTKPAPGPPRSADLEQSFPQLEVIGLLGQGGMGYVYKARQRGLDRLVALKLLPQEVSKESDFAERFGREARALAKLSHPGIVVVHDSGQVGGLYYFIMEYIEGLNLRELLQRNEGRLDTDRALQIVHSVCDALEYAHDEGVVHRDIKPENILLDLKGRVKIADFGLAKLLGAEDDGSPSHLTLNSPQQMLGTPHYMAPEQTERPLTVDHRADIYSIGVVFYEMITGELPLGRFPLPSEIGRGAPILDDIVLRALEKNPDRRFQRASEVQSAVAAALSGPPATGSGVAALAATPAPGLAATPAMTPMATPFPTPGNPGSGVASGVGTYVDVMAVQRWMKLPALLLILSAVTAFLAFNPLGVLTIIGASKMKKLEGRTLAIAGAILALMPWNIFPPLGWVAGAWALILLCLPQTRAAYRAVADARRSMFR
jgi:predicted Ser/Thr protein kinase